MSGHNPGEIAIPDEVAGGTPTRPTQVTPALLRRWPLPEPGGSKYQRGQLVVLGGARATPGAAMLAGVAGLRVGAGRLSLGVAASIAPHAAVAVPECGVLALPEDEDGSVSGVDAGRLLQKELQRTNAVLIGPGLDEPEGTIRLLAEVAAVLPNATPVVLDAYGATVLPDVDKSILDQLRGRLVLTPNTGEMARLLGVDEVDDDRNATLTCAKRYGAAVACNSWVAFEGRLWQLTTGDTGLGTSGSGDVVAGTVAGLLSRGAGLAQALIWGKHTHAAAGDVLAARFGRVGFLAREIGPELPRVLASLGGD